MWHCCSSIPPAAQPTASQPYRHMFKVHMSSWCLFFPGLFSLSGAERSGRAAGVTAVGEGPQDSGLMGPLLYSAPTVSRDYSAVWFHQMRLHPWMGTVWPWWADLRGINSLLWRIGKNSGRLSTHSCVFVCFIMYWPLAPLWLWLQPWTTFPSHWPRSSGSS